MSDMSHVPLRVLFVVPGLAIGWRMIFTKNDIAAIEKLGVQGCSFHLLSRTSPRRLIKEAMRFRKAIKEFRPDLVHVHYGTVSACFCAALTALPLVVTYQGSDLNPCSSMNGVRSAVGRLLSQLAALRADRLVCVSRELRDRLWWNRTKASILPSGVNTTLFHPLPRDEARARLGWGLREKIVISSAGTDPIRKRLDLARAGVRAAEARCGPIRLVVLDGSTAHEEMPILLNAADCLLMTSDWEGSPNVVKEAIACDLPVVSVPVGDVAERLRFVRPSSIVARDPAELGAALAELLTCPMRSNGQDVIHEVAADRFAQQMVSIYGEMVRDSKIPPMREGLEA